MRPPRQATVLTAALLVSCGGDSPGDLRSADAPGAAFALEEELRIGGLAGSEEYTFGYVSALAPAPDGSFYVADGQVPLIRRYDAEGRHVGDVGRSGEGPGEYLSIDGMGVLPDGRLVVWDGRNKRVSFFGPGGGFVRSLQVPSALGAWRSFALSPDGDVYVLVAPEEGLVESPQGFRADWAKVDATGTVERVAAAPPQDAVGPRYVLSGRGGYYRPFVTMTLHAMGPDGSLYQVRNDEYRIRRTRPDGRETEITREERPIQVTTEERKEWETRSESFAERTPERRSEYFPIPDSTSTVTAISGFSAGAKQVNQA